MKEILFIKFVYEEDKTIIDKITNLCDGYDIKWSVTENIFENE